MRKLQLDRAMAITVLVLLVVGAAPLLAEDSGVFKNGTHIEEAQGILVGEGHLDSYAFTPSILDEATQAALAEYQSAHALNSRGTLDDETFQMLTSHETAYPWGGQEKVSEAQTEMAEPAPEPAVVEAPPVPAPTPSPVVEKQALARPAADQPSGELPATGSDLPLLALSGLALIGGGTLLLRQRAV